MRIDGAGMPMVSRPPQASAHAQVASAAANPQGVGKGQKAATAQTQIANAVQAVRERQKVDTPRMQAQQATPQAVHAQPKTEISPKQAQPQTQGQAKMTHSNPSMTASAPKASHSAPTPKAQSPKADTGSTQALKSNDQRAAQMAQMQRLSQMQTYNATAKVQSMMTAETVKGSALDFRG